uniref:Uncharacterized protein n=1 Tax=Meloidogyne enterolobii TaxID=390850 RepID=A0A6V7VE34_MELEN|nr:unnamed protein product [Meloidogyne enterolobii]
MYYYLYKIENLLRFFKLNFNKVGTQKRTRYPQLWIDQQKMNGIIYLFNIFLKNIKKMLIFLIKYFYNFLLILINTNIKQYSC